MNPLDYPVRASLFASCSDHLSLGDDRARRYRPDIHPFAAAVDDSPAALDALARRVGQGERITLMQVPAIAVPRGLHPVERHRGVQLIAAQALTEAEPDPDIVTLGEADAEDMLALAALTRPGPYARNTWRMGRYVGIRINGRLAAMAGERLRFPGYTEVSGVCTHPDFRGRGLAQRLSRHVAAHIAARGDTAFMHAWRDNTPAITLYQKLGFKLRCEIDLAVLEKTVANAAKSQP